MKRQWADLRFNGQKAPWFAEFRDRMGWLGRPPDLPTFEQFDRMVADWNAWNATMLPENPNSFGETYTAAQLADHFGSR